MPAAAWRRRADAHLERVRRWTDPARARKAGGESHPVLDFLFTYYFLTPARLEQWHPGHGIPLESAPDLPRWLRHPPYHESGGTVRLPPDGPDPDKRSRLQWILDLLVATRDRPPHFACHGLHEWAMVYSGTEVRHRESCPLRLTQVEIDRLVESRPLCCTHFDAFRFFHPAARPLNRFEPTLDRRQALEQPGCVHTNMDLYKWTAKSMPWAGSDLLLDAFALALDLRELDMRASPYDLRAYGLDPVPIETEDGRRDYVRLQQQLAARAAPLRQRLIAILRSVLEPTPRKPPSTFPASRDPAKTAPPPKKPRPLPQKTAPRSPPNLARPLQKRAGLASSP